GFPPKLFGVLRGQRQLLHLLRGVGNVNALPAGGTLGLSTGRLPRGFDVLTATLALKLDHGSPRTVFFRPRRPVLRPEAGRGRSSVRPARSGGVARCRLRNIIRSGTSGNGS